MGTCTPPPPAPPPASPGQRPASAPHLAFAAGGTLLGGCHGDGQLYRVPSRQKPSRRLDLAGKHGV